MIIQPRVSFTAPDGTRETLFIGNLLSIAAMESGIRSAINEVRHRGGTNAVLQLVGGEGFLLQEYPIRLDAASP